MRFFGKQGFENGWRLPKWQLAFQHAIEGELWIGIVSDPGWQRETLQATFRTPGSTAEIWPPLLDVRVVEMTCDRLIVAGIQRAGFLPAREYAQSWVLYAAKLSEVDDVQRRDSREPAHQDPVSGA